MSFRPVIPGMSLTTTPGNAQYERPPDIVDPREALKLYMDRLNDPDVMDSAMTLVEAGLDLRRLTEGVLRKGVMEGVHSIDVSLIIAPAIHELFRTTAEEIGLEYDEGFDETNKETLKKAKVEAMLLKESPEAPVEEMEEMVEEEPVMQEQPRGLMARR